MYDLCLSGFSLSGYKHLRGEKFCCFVYLQYQTGTRQQKHKFSIARSNDNDDKDNNVDDDIKYYDYHGH